MRLKEPKYNEIIYVHRLSISLSPWRHPLLQAGSSLRGRPGCAATESLEDPSPRQPTQMDQEAKNLSALVVSLRDHFNSYFCQLLNTSMSHQSPLLDLESGFRYEYSMLQQSVSDYLGQIDDLITLLPRKRVKKGLINAGGSVLKYLFGTLDNSDLDTVNGKLDYLYDSNEQIVHDQKEQVTVLSNMQTELVNHTRTINLVLEALRKYHASMHAVLPKFFKKTEEAEVKLQHLFKYLKLSSALAETKDAVSSAVAKVNKFHQAIEDLAGGRVSSNLLYPHDFVRLYRQSQKRYLSLPSCIYRLIWRIYIATIRLLKSVVTQMLTLSGL